MKTPPIQNFARTIVKAENDYYGSSAGERYREYAARLISTPGTHDGLAWEANEANRPVQWATSRQTALAEGYHRARPRRQSVPVHGYYFRILDRQGASATGGDKDYMATVK